MIAVGTIVHGGFYSISVGFLSERCSYDIRSVWVSVIEPSHPQLKKLLQSKKINAFRGFIRKVMSIIDFKFKLKYKNHDFPY